MARVWFFTAAGAVAFVGLVGLAHLPAARPLLRICAGGACPVGADAPADPAVIDQARASTLPALRGETAAASRPAAGFRLDEDDAASVAAWAVQHKLSCAKEGALTTCGPVPAGLLPEGRAHDTISFQFDANDKLVTVMARVNALPAEEAAATVQARTAVLEAAVGPAYSARGDAASLSKPLSQVSAEFRFTDYRAQLTATHVGGGRIAYREVFQSLRLAG
jgi:hypothetical protein